MLSDRLSSPFLTTDTTMWNPQGVEWDARFEFTDTQVDRVMLEPSSRDDGGYAAPPDLYCFGGSPAPPHPLVHERKKQVELASEAIDDNRVGHTGSRTPKTKSVKILLPDS